MYYWLMVWLLSNRLCWNKLHNVHCLVCRLLSTNHPHYDELHGNRAEKKSRKGLRQSIKLMVELILADSKVCMPHLHSMKTFYTLGSIFVSSQVYRCDDIEFEHLENNMKKKKKLKD